MANKWNQLEQGAKRRRSNQGTRGSTHPAASNPNKNRKSTDTNRNNSRPAAAKPAPKAAPKQNKPKTVYYSNKNKGSKGVAAGVRAATRTVTTKATNKVEAKKPQIAGNRRLGWQAYGRSMATGRDIPTAMNKPKNFLQTVTPLEQMKADAVVGPKYWGARASVPSKSLTAEQQKKKTQQTAKQSGFNARARKQTLSSYDQKLSQGKQFQIQQAKQRFDEAKAKGDSAGMAKAHREAEGLRYGSGYSGGASGNEYITGNLTQDDYNRLNADGQKAMKQAKLTRSRAVTEEEIARADRRIEEILNAPGYRNNRLSAAETGKGWTYGPDGRRMWSGTKEQNAEDARRDLAAVKSIPYGIAGTAVSAFETGKQANDDMRTRTNMEQWLRDADDYVSAKNDLEYYDNYVQTFGEPPEGMNRNVLVMRLNNATQAKAQLNRMWTDPQSAWYDPTQARRLGTPDVDAYSLTGRGNLDSPMQAMYKAGTHPDFENPEPTLGDRLLGRRNELVEEAMEGRNGFDRALTELALSIGDSAPRMALGLIPGVGPGLAALAFGVGAYGDEAYELKQRGVPSEERALRGLVSGGIEAGTNVIPVEHFAANMLGRLGENALKNIGVQSAEEAIQEGSSYALNALSDYVSGDPEATFSLGELAKNMAMGAASGAVFGTVGSFVSSGRDIPPEAQAHINDIDGIMEQSQQYEEMVRQGALSAEEGAAIQSQLQQDLVNKIQSIRDNVQTINDYQSMADQGVISQAEADQVRDTYGESITGQQASSREALERAASQRLYQAAMAANSINAETPAQAEARQAAERTGRVQGMYQRGQSVMGAYQADREAQLAREIREAQQTEPTETASTVSPVEEAQRMTDEALRQKDNALRQAAEARARAEAIQNAVPVQETRPTMADVANQRLEAISGTMGEKGSQALMTMAGEMNNTTAVRDFVRVYNQALMGNTGIEAPRSMTQAEFNRATEAGIADRMAGITLDLNRGKKAPGRNKNAGVDWADPYVRGLDRQTAKTVDAIAKLFGDKIEFVDYVEGRGNGNIVGNVIQIAKDNPNFKKNPVLFVAGHESTHRMQRLDPESYRAFANYVMSRPGANEMLEGTLADYKKANALESGVNERWQAIDEYVSDYAGTLLRDHEELRQFIRDMQQPKVLRALLKAFRAVRDVLTGRERAQADEAVRLLEEAIKGAEKSLKKSEREQTTASPAETAARVGVLLDEETNSAAPTLYSLGSWNRSEYVQDRDAAAKALAKQLKVTQKEAKRFIDSVNSVAKIIADYRARLDYLASPGRSPFVSNVEYGGSIDFSTICKKRRLFTGTIDAIQRAMPDRVLMADEMLKIRAEMKKRDYEVGCGLCYVEGSRVKIGKYTKEFLDGLKAEGADYIPTLAEMNTVEGQEDIRLNHPETYEKYVKFMNKLAQRKPKLFQMATEYKREILDAFEGKEDTVKEKNKNGGLRLQSFSDFEIIHLIDSMQVIMDMSRVGLSGQAYTKQPEFAWALGETGLKINLSLIAKGVDENGRLIFDDVEGMPIKDAMELRDRYSKNVGTVIVVFNDQQLLAALADDRIDFVLPFHRSQWNKKQYDVLGLPQGTKDYTLQQNEKYIMPVRHQNRNGKWVKERPANYMPNEYWNFRKSGKWNAEQYLKMCAENNRRPKFFKLLVNNGDGSYSLQPDGSTDGYWKLLIDFKMYDNEGKGSPQKPVRPEFNMDEAQKMLKDYEGGHENFPVAQDIVDEFVAGKRFSITPQTDADYLAAVESGDMETAQRMVKDAAAKAGYTEEGYHGTLQFGFTVPDVSVSDDKISFFLTSDIGTASTYSTKDNVRRIGKTQKDPEEVEEAAREKVHEAVMDYVEYLNRAVGIQSYIQYDIADDFIDILEGINDGDSLVVGLQEFGEKEDEMHDEWLLRIYEQDHLDDFDSFPDFQDWYYDGGRDTEYSKVTEAREALYEAFHEAANIWADNIYGGNYHFYFDPTNLLEVDGDGRNWNQISFMPEELKRIKDRMDAIERAHVRGSGPLTDNEEWVRLSDEFDEKAQEIYNQYLINPRNTMTTRGIARYASAKGYSGVHFKNLIDDGGRGDKRVEAPADVYIMFHPQMQVKSADPVTYDDDGNVIPLSERFNAENQDIRYSLSGVDNVVAFPQNGRRSDAAMEAEFERLTSEFAKVMSWPDSLPTVDAYRLHKDDPDWKIGMLATNGSADRAKELRDQIKQLLDQALNPSSGNKQENTSNTEAMRTRLSPGDWMFRQVEKFAKENSRYASGSKSTLDDVYQYIEEELKHQQDWRGEWDRPELLDEWADAIRATDPKDENSVKNLVEKTFDIYRREGTEFPVFGEYYDDYAGGNRYSLGTEGYDRARLMRENQQLKEKLDYWRGQVKKSDRTKADPKEVRKLAKSLRTDYSTEMDAGEITQRLQAIYDGIGKDWTYDRAYEEAGKLARDMIEQATATDDYLYAEYEPMRKFFQDTPLVVTPEMKRAIPDYNEWRKPLFGNLRLQGGDKTNVDKVFQEAVEKWPEWFNEEVTPNSVDQLERIAEVMDGIYTRDEANPFEDDIAGPAGYLTTQIMDSFWDVPSIKKTFADRAEARLGREVTRRLDMKERYENALRKVREQRDRKLKEQSKRYLTAKRKRSKQQKERELRAKIVRHVKKLSTKLTRPTDTQHIPEALVDTVRTALESINLASKDMKDTKRTQAFAALQKMYQEMEKNGSEVVIDPDLLPNISDIIGFADTPIANLGLEDLNTIWQTVRAIEASISTFNKALGRARFETISQPAFGIRDYLTGRKDRGDYRGPFRPMDKLLNFNMLTPEAYFLRMGNSGKEVFRMLRDAQDRHITIMDQAQRKTREIVGKTDIKKLEKEKHTFTFDGQTVELTTAQIMSLYELMKRQQAVDHVMIGGIRPESVKKGIKDLPPARPWHLTQDQVSKVVDSLTEEQVKLADDLQKYMGGTMAELGNEASMEVYGYRKFTEKHYFPISVDKNQTQSDVKNDAVSGTIAGWGSARPVKPNANNAVILRSIFDVYADHTTEMANYASWLAPMENLNRIFNFRYKDAEGNPTGTFKDQLEKLFGRNGSAYWKQLQADLNNGVHGRDDSPFSAFMGTYKASAIGANIRVIAQQPTAILRALDSINPADFVAGMAKARIGKFDKVVKQYAPIAIWKDWGYFQQDTGRQMRNVLFNDDTMLQRTNSAMMWGAGKADSLSWTAIWNALESETRRKRKDLRYKSKEFYEAVAERFNEVVDHTQVVDGILQRSQIMRSADGLTKMATSFMAEPTKTYNMLLSAIYEARNAKGRDRTAAMSHMAKTAFALTVSITVNAAAQSLVDAIRDDDKDEEYWEKFIQAYFGLEGDTRRDQIKNGILNGNLEAAFNPLSYIPYLKDIISQTQGYTVSRMDMDTISRVLKAFTNVEKAMSGEGKNTVQSAWLNLALEASRFLGLSVANLKRDVQTVLRTFFAGTGNYRMLYKQEKFLYDVTSKNTLTEFSKLILGAERAGDEEAAQAIRQDMIDSGVDAEKIDKKLAELRKKAVTDTEEFQAALSQKMDAYNTMLEASEQFQAFTEDQQTKARGIVEDYAEWQAYGDQIQLTEKDQATFDKIQAAEADQIDPALYAVCVTAFADMHNDKDENGNDIEGQHQQDKVIRFIKALPDLTSAQRSALYHLKYDNDKNNPWA